MGFNLGLSDAPITALPKGLTIVGFLDIRRTSITALPSNLSVGGHLYLDETAITALPEGLVLGECLKPGTSSALRFPTAWFAAPHAETRWRALASDGVYTLMESDAGEIAAGCRGPWSREEALAHWGDRARTDERAKLFIAALRALPAMGEPRDAPHPA